MTLCYTHCPPGFKPPPIPDRLRAWDDSSPYHKNRPRRAPRGGNVLQLLRQPVTFNNVPKLERITVSTYTKEALREGSAPFHVAGMAIQAITNHRITPHLTKSNVPTWGVVKGKTWAGITADLRGEDMYHFFGKLVDVVLPRVKDWPGVKATSGDSSGNITLGLQPKMVALFPEIEVNYDMYVALPLNPFSRCFWSLLLLLLTRIVGTLPTKSLVAISPFTQLLERTRMLDSSSHTLAFPSTVNGSGKL